MKIGYLQFKPEFGNIKENIKRIENYISKEEFDLLVLPELVNTGYLFTSRQELEDYSEEAGKGEFSKMLMRISSEKNCHIVAGFCEKSENKFFNSSMLVYPDKTFRLYRKIHLFYEEKFFFEPGNLKFRSSRNIS